MWSGHLCSPWTVAQLSTLHQQDCLWGIGKEAALEPRPPRALWGLPYWWDLGSFHLGFTRNRWELVET